MTSKNNYYDGIGNGYYRGVMNTFFFRKARTARAQPDAIGATACSEASATTRNTSYKLRHIYFAKYSSENALLWCASPTAAAVIAVMLVLPCVCCCIVCTCCLVSAAASSARVLLGGGWRRPPGARSRFCVGVSLSLYAKQT